MARVRKRITLKKAAQSFLLYGAAVGGALTQIDIPEGDLSDKVLLTLGVSTLAAVLRAVNNVRKRKAAPTVSGYGGVHYGLLLAVGLALAGCVTTTGLDGTTTTALDPVALSTAWDAWERLDRRRVDLEREREQADAADRARLDTELHELEPEIARLAERLGL